MVNTPATRLCTSSLVVVNRIKTMTRVMWLSYDDDKDDHDVVGDDEGGV